MSNFPSMEETVSSIDCGLPKHEQFDQRTTKLINSGSSMLHKSQRHILCSTYSENQSRNTHLDKDHINHIIWRKFMTSLPVGEWTKGWENEWQSEERLGCQNRLVGYRRKGSMGG